MQLKIALGVPTFSRANILKDTIDAVKLQSRKPDLFVICCSSLNDHNASLKENKDVSILYAGQGLAKQRNSILNKCLDYDIIVYFDDDFIPKSNYIEEIENVFLKDQKIVLVTGKVIRDGISGPGLSSEQGMQILKEDNGWQEKKKFVPVFGGYGCNMAIRTNVAQKNHILFDERLPLYGWQEDNDFSRRYAKFGTVVQTNTARGVHLGAKVGRSSGVRLGYSQVVNPLYIWKKHRAIDSAGYPLKYAITRIGKNMFSNTMRSLRPETYVDRRGRLRGNLIAVYDLLRRKALPERILDL